MRLFNYEDKSGYKTYATPENAIKAVKKEVEKWGIDIDDYRWVVMVDDEMRYKVLFLGADALEMVAHQSNFTACVA